MRFREQPKPGPTQPVLKSGHFHFPMHHLITIPGAPAKAVHQLQLEIIERYQEPQRRWHTLAHIYQMQEVLSALSKETDPVLNCACWFHDIVYVPGRPDNEAASAELAREALSLLVEGPFVDQVVECIMATERHLQHEGLEARVAVFLDADLAILAASAEEYDFYAAAIRAEYSEVEEGRYRAGRGAVLRGFLERERIFSHHAPVGWEGKARGNIERELERLVSEG